MSVKRVCKEAQNALKDSNCEFTLVQSGGGEGEVPVPGLPGVPPFVETTEDGNCCYTILFDTSDEILGMVGIRIVHPADYPFKAFRMKIDPAHCSNIPRLRYKFQHVCPDLSNWRELCLDSFMQGQGYFSTCLIPELTDKWSPAHTVIKVLRGLALGKRLSGPSFEEAYPMIIKAIPDLKEGEEGVAKIVFGGYMEGTSWSSSKNSSKQEFVLLMDPLYTLEGADCLDISKGERYTCVVLSAAWCFKDPNSWQTMEQLLQELAAKSFTQITVHQSGIRLKMPGNLPTTYGSGRGYITTAGSYGGEMPAAEATGAEDAPVAEVVTAMQDAPATRTPENAV